MRHLIIVAHPSEDSFTMGLTRAYAAELETLAHSQLTYDLYRMGFNPVLTSHELAQAAGEHPASPDVVRAQNDIRTADAISVVYPLWWLSMPTILKGYIDRVFARGFAYEYHNGIVHGLLSGKKSVLITISGAPMPLLLKSGDWSAVQVLQDKHIFRQPGSSCLSTSISTRWRRIFRMSLLKSTWRASGLALASIFQLAKGPEHRARKRGYL
jgi:NAD(P)H dehydrogenase (quinone)